MTFVFSKAGLWARDLALGAHPLLEGTALGEVAELSLPDAAQEHDRGVRMAQVLRGAVGDAPLPHLGDDVLHLHLVGQEPLAVARAQLQWKKLAPHPGVGQRAVRLDSLL